MIEKLLELVNDYIPGFEMPNHFPSRASSGRCCHYLISCIQNKHLFLDEQFEELTGYENQKMHQGGMKWWFSIVHSEDFESMLRIILINGFLQAPQKRLEKSYYAEYRIKKPDGSWAWIGETKCVLTISDEGKNDLLLGRLEDISGAKKNNENSLDKVLEEQGETNPLLSAALPLLMPARYKQSASREKKAPAKLTKRELEILNLIGEGYSTKEIAGRLFISINTVETHRRHLLEKMEVKNSMELVKQAGNPFWLKTG